MDPVVGAGITAGGALISNLITEAIRAEEEKKKREQEAMLTASDMQMKAAQGQATGTQTAFQSLIDSYRQAFQRPQI